MLESMFPDDLTISDEEAVALFKSFVESLDDDDDGRRNDLFQTDLPPNLSFDLRLRLDIDDIRHNGNESSSNCLELCLTLSALYPRVPPTLFLRTAFARTQEARLRKAIDGFLSSQPEGELYVVNLVEFVKEKVVDVLKDDGGEGLEKEEEEMAGSSSARCTKKKMIRMWIYSHHIYSMQKRKFILEWSRELGLTGFSMPGKPGVVCVEGLESSVDELWTRLRKLNWKRLAIKERETIAEDVTEGGAGDNHEENRGKGVSQDGRKFADFEEISFDVKQGQGRNYHMDMGKFLDFLKTHDCENIFKLYFGVDGT